MLQEIIVIIKTLEAMLIESKDVIIKSLKTNQNYMTEESLKDLNLVKEILLKINEVK